MNDLAESVLNGSRRALARLLTQVENESEGVGTALAALFPHTGKAWVIGITGAPGTGKSSLVNKLARHYRQQDNTVAIIAVDPTSPFSGGAILGDRIRMHDLSGDKGVFIRSMATRGNLGGLAKTTRDLIRVFDAAGFDIILVETVGAGQSEVDIVRTAHTTVVVEAPGLGDDVQAIKAGILEIADVLVVNKADRPGARNTVRVLRAMLELGHPTNQRTRHHRTMMDVETVQDTQTKARPLWIPPIIETVATEGQGFDELVNAISDHRKHLQDQEIMAESEHHRMQLELQDRIQLALMREFWTNIGDEALCQIAAKVVNREIDPQTAVDTMLSTYRKQKMD